MTAATIHVEKGLNIVKEALIPAEHPLRNRAIGVAPGPRHLLQFGTVPFEPADASLQR